ncbi:hypothetical protein MTO96_031125 [Rhipicephalus appendiculatus]
MYQLPEAWSQVRRVPAPKKLTLSAMWRETRQVRGPLLADMYPLWWKSSYRHRLVQGQDARASTTDSAETQATSAHDKGLPAPRAQTRSPATLDQSRKCAQCITEGRRGSTPAGRGKASEGSH